jgi:hypothetical protein
LGSFLIFYAISLGQPALVDAISGVRYVIIFLGALLLTRLHPDWLKEHFRGWQFVTKASATCLVVAGLVLIGMSGGNEQNSGGVAVRRRNEAFERSVARSAQIPSPSYAKVSAQSIARYK